MIEVIFKDGTFKAKGSFSLGIAGVSVNEDFDGRMITFDRFMYNYIKDRDSYYVEPILPFIKSDDPDEIAKNLADYYNQKEREIAANAKQINDCILYRLFDDFEGCAEPFWEIPEAVLPGYLEEYDEDEYEDVVYCHREGVVHNLYQYFEDKPNNGTIEKPDAEALIRKLYPMFNLDGFIKSFKPEGVCFDGRFMEFQFSDEWGAELACAAYDKLDENFTFNEWHNH